MSVDLLLRTLSATPESDSHNTFLISRGWGVFSRASCLLSVMPALLVTTAGRDSASVLHLLTHDPLSARVQVEHIFEPLPATGAHRHQVIAGLVGPRVAVVQTPG